MIRQPLPTLPSACLTRRSLICSRLSRRPMPSPLGPPCGRHGVAISWRSSFGEHTRQSLGVHCRSCRRYGCRRRCCCHAVAAVAAVAAVTAAAAALAALISPLGSPARPAPPRLPAAANPKEAERIADILQNDLKVASEQLVKARRERLRDLYAAELRQWQDELAQRGLALPSAGPGTD